MLSLSFFSVKINGPSTYLKYCVNVLAYAVAFTKHERSNAKSVKDSIMRRPYSFFFEDVPILWKHSNKHDCEVLNRHSSVAAYLVSQPERRHDRSLSIPSSGKGGRGKGTHSPGPVKISHKIYDRQRQPQRFHASCKHPTPLPGLDPGLRKRCMSPVFPFHLRLLVVLWDFRVGGVGANFP